MDRIIIELTLNEDSPGSTINVISAFECGDLAVGSRKQRSQASKQLSSPVFFVLTGYDLVNASMVG